jgi:ABC-type branched-subunit amino acid transport system ATPase component
MSILSVKNLSKSFGKLEVLNDISLTIWEL